MDAGTPRYEPYRGTAPGPFRWRLGLRPLDIVEWIQVDAGYDRDIAEKLRVLAAHHETAFAVLDGVEDEAGEVLEALVAHLRTLDPGRFGGVTADPDLHPLDAAGRLVQEDLVLMVERDGGLVCAGGSVCFPNRWDLASKVGLPIAAIHAPVAQLNEQLEAPIERFLGRLTPDKSFWRLGWGVNDDDELFQPPDRPTDRRAADPSPAAHFLRVERETFRRFPGPGCVLFTIRTFVNSLSDAAGDLDAPSLAAAIDAFPADVAAYKQLDGVREELATWLREVAAAGGSSTR